MRVVRTKASLGTTASPLGLYADRQLTTISPPPTDECCQGVFNFFCCQAGSLGEQNCPDVYLCCEVLCCPSCAISGSRSYIMQEKRLTSDPCDRRIIRCNNALQCFSCICSLVYMCTGQCGDAARIIRRISDLVYCCVQGCMTVRLPPAVDPLSSTFN